MNIRGKNGLTLISLIITIIILIILACVTINLTIGDNGLFNMAKRAKSDYELSAINEELQLNELYTQIDIKSENTDDTSKFNNDLIEFKTAIANYIEEVGGVKPKITDNISAFEESIKGIVKEVTKDANAVSDDIKDGKTAYVNGEKITGTLKQGSMFNVFFSSAHWSSKEGSCSADSRYNITDCKKIQLNVNLDKPDGTIKINTNNKTLISTNCDSLAAKYTFDVSDDTLLYISRSYTYGYVGIEITNVE